MPRFRTALAALLAAQLLRPAAADYLTELTAEDMREEGGRPTQRTEKLYDQVR